MCVTTEKLYDTYCISKGRREPERQLFRLTVLLLEVRLFLQCLSQESHHPDLSTDGWVTLWRHLSIPLSPCSLAALATGATWLQSQAREIQTSASSIRHGSLKTFTDLERNRFSVKGFCLSGQARILYWQQQFCCWGRREVCQQRSNNFIFPQPLVTEGFLVR